MSCFAAKEEAELSAKCREVAMKIWLAILAAGMVLGASVEDASAGKRVFFGDGANSCTTWTDARARHPQRARLLEEWVLGFVSGANIYDDSPEMLKQMDERAIFAWIDDYCRAHAVELVDDAAFELMQELLRRTDKAEHP
jgi:hypothetical protein